MEKRIVIFRHGYTEYTQGTRRVTLEEASDLCMPGSHDIEVRKREAVEQVCGNALFASPLLDGNKPIAIVSSEAGRCLHTAKCIQSSLRICRMAVGDIQMNCLLNEVSNFSWPLFEAAVNGGIIDLDDQQHEIRKELSNPTNVDEDDYFYFDHIHNLPRESFEKLPEPFLRRVLAFETSQSCRQRMIEMIRIAAEDRRIHQWIFVTHTALGAEPVRNLTGNEKKELVPGGWVALSARGIRVFPFAGLNIGKVNPSPMFL